MTISLITQLHIYFTKFNWLKKLLKVPEFEIIIIGSVFERFKKLDLDPVEKKGVLEDLGEIYFYFIFLG